MRYFLYSLIVTVFLLAGCAAAPEPVSTPVPTKAPTLAPTAIPRPQRAPLLRIAVFGEVTTTNVWALFDEAGADYWNQATQAAYWPQLYQLAHPSLDVMPAAAKGMPLPLVCNTDTCTATVTLQPNLMWTNGSPFTAQDVAFTVNTALQFELGLNWALAYNPDVLERAEALDNNTVRYYFITRPNINNWYYGVLQGPIVNQAYWQPRIADAASLLPDEDLLPAIRELESQFNALQTRIDALNASLNTMAPASSSYQDTSRQATRIQEELNSIANKLAKNRAEYESRLAEAQRTLFALANTNEPTLGAWSFASRADGNFENQVNLGTPFGDSWFDAVRYTTFSNELAAVQALENDEIDIILSKEGLSADAISRLKDNIEITLRRSETRRARFLAFNQANPYFADPAIRQALACVLNPQTLGKVLNDQAAPLTGFVLDDFWRAEKTSLPCADETDDARLEQAVKIMKAAGYSWEVEPDANVSGIEARNPNGGPLPRFTIHTSKDDPLRVDVAEYVAQQAEKLGILVDVRLSDTDSLLYAVYGSGGYDLALIGWRLSVSPAYLCEWFMPVEQNPFAYDGGRLTASCEASKVAGDLDQAQAYVSEIQSILSQGLPLIPLYVNMRTDGYRNVSFPFEDMRGGLSRLYGAPTLATPLP